jgi:hypothetical protein
MVNSGTCRPILCREHRDCGYFQYGCDNGFCIGMEGAYENRPVSRTDVQALCLAGTGPRVRTEAQLERLRFAARDCPDDDHCRVPPECVASSDLLRGAVAAR